MASSKFTQAVESYFTELRLVRGFGGATHERPLYVPLPTCWTRWAGR